MSNRSDSWWIRIEGCDAASGANGSTLHNATTLALPGDCLIDPWETAGCHVGERPRFRRSKIHPNLVGSRRWEGLYAPTLAAASARRGVKPLPPLDPRRVSKLAAHSPPKKHPPIEAGGNNPDCAIGRLVGLLVPLREFQVVAELWQRLLREGRDVRVR